MNFTQLINSFHRYQCTRLYVKVLAENDNSKNQIYLGSDFSAVTILPYQKINKSSNQYKAELDFSWLSDYGTLKKAAHAQLILYPQYPEVRFSGFLLGCQSAPSYILTKREAGRLLFFGITSTNTIIGYADQKDTPLNREFMNLGNIPKNGVFFELTSILAGRDIRTDLLNHLREIHRKQWIDSKRLNSTHQVLPCNASNCGGYTLEAEFGIVPNGKSEPDFHGWELKQHSVSQFSHYKSGVITLMTPEPTGGYYKEVGVIPFIKKYGYLDKCGRSDRMNFGGLHYAGKQNATTGLTLTIQGYDESRGKICDLNGGIALVSSKGNIAALWHFSSLLEHWNRKHSNAAYIPSMFRKGNKPQYWYGNLIRLGEGTDFSLFLSAISSGRIYYDPGIKVEKVSTGKPLTKRRSQFRTKSSEINHLYRCMEQVNVLENVN